MSALRCLIGRHEWQWPLLTFQADPEPGKWASATVAVQVCRRCHTLAFRGMGTLS